MIAAVLITIDAIGIVAAFFCLILLLNHARLALYALRADMPAAQPHGFDQTNAPQVLVQIPVYNESRSVELALMSASRLEWPQGKLCIQLLDDSTDHTSEVATQTIARLGQRGMPIAHIRRSDRSGFKAGALAAGLQRCEAPFVAVLDVDFRAPPNWLYLAVSALNSNSDAGFVQFRFEYANRDANMLTRAQQLSVDTHFLIEQKGRLAAGEPFQFNGTAGVWRRAAIDAAGGWSGDTLTEDLDLVLRAYAQGWHGLLHLDPPIVCEAPMTLAAWQAQQARWSRGFMQVAGRAFPSIWKMRWSLSKKIAMSLFVGMQMAFPFSVAAILALILDACLRGPVIAHAAIIIGSLAIVASLVVLITYPAHRRLQRGNKIRYVMTLACLPALLAFLAVVNSFTIVTALFGGRGDFVRTPKSGDSIEKRGSPS